MITHRHEVQNDLLEIIEYQPSQFDGDGNRGEIIVHQNNGSWISLILALASGPNDIFTCFLCDAASASHSNADVASFKCRGVIHTIAGLE
jgi:hypothetical protein